MKTYTETNRFILREIIPTDAHDFFELDSDPEVHRFLGNQPVKSIDECKAVIQGVQKQYVENGIGRWAIIEKTTGDFIGWSGLKYEQGLRRDFSYYDLGYRLKRKYWGQGIATETAIASLKYGFEKMQLKQICAAAHIENLASNTILRKIGMHWKESFEYEGVTCHWYELLESEWAAANKFDH